MIPVQSKLFPTVLKEPNTLFWYVGRRFVQQPSTSMARRTEQVPWSSSPLYFVDEIMSTCLVSKYSAYWPIYGLIYILYRFCLWHWRLKLQRNTGSLTTTNNAHISRTTTRPPRISSPTPCSCGHMDVFGFDIFNVLYCPKMEFYTFSWNQVVYTYIRRITFSGVSFIFQECTRVCILM